MTPSNCGMGVSIPLRKFRKYLVSDGQGLSITGFHPSKEV